jgi:hypothetical protein
MEEGYLLGTWSWISDKNQITTREAKKSLATLARTAVM